MDTVPDRGANGGTCQADKEGKHINISPLAGQISVKTNTK